MAAKHPVSGRVSEEVASAIDIALAETSDALQINEESWLWALTHHSRGAAAGPSGLTMECWKDVCAPQHLRFAPRLRQRHLLPCQVAARFGTPLGVVQHCGPDQEG